MAELLLRDIRKSFGKVEAIHGVNLEIKHREFVVFVGPSGCGKSTLLRMIAGLEDITSGDLLIDSQRVNPLPPAKRGIAMVFQSYALYPHMTTYENMAFGLELAHASKADIDKRVREAAATLELTPLLDRLPKQLSGGQRQRVAIGRAIVRNPKVFLFDEPLSNLDAALRVQMRIEIAKLHERLDTTMIYVTHDQVEAMTLADKIVVLNSGNVEQVGSPLTLYHQPDNLFVAGFIGSPQMNFLQSRVDACSEQGLRCALPGGAALVVPVEPGGIDTGAPITLGIRPEHLAMDGGAPARIEGRVDVVEQLGESHLIYLELPGGQRLVARLPGDATARLHEAIAVAIRPEDCHVFRRDGRALRRHPSAYGGARPEMAGQPRA
ncbi:MAG TPA: sn-glycerol-3-phosphate ABC transporter ATP-binding protein UgpC [Paracoccaceae bacterium]|nr:sn-glycerol-3-phosphate ABC transporter ATP-binding protein UgpC [Paracoccaceae bacterium]